MKGKNLLIYFGFLSLFLIGFVSAYSVLGLRDISQSVVDSYVDTFEPILQALFGGFGWTGLYLFERFLLFIVLVGIIHLSLRRVPFFDNAKGVRWIVAIVVPLIGIRFINYEQLTTIIFQYQVLAVALTVVLPFIIYFFFVHNVAGDYPIVRKVAWILFIAVYWGLWSTADSNTNSDIYFWVMVVAFTCLILDNYIHKTFLFKQIAKQDASFKWREIGNINTKIQELHRQINSAAIPARIGNREIIELERQKRILMRHLT